MGPHIIASTNTLFPIIGIEETNLDLLRCRGNLAVSVVKWIFSKMTNAAPPSPGGAQRPTIPPCAYRKMVRVQSGIGPVG